MIGLGRADMMMVPMDNFAFLLPFFMTVFGGIFLLARLWGHSSATPWGIGYLCAALAFCLPMLRFIPEPVGAIIANALFLTTFFFYGEALTRRFRRNGHRTARLAVAVLSIAALSWSILFRGDLRSELILGDVTLVLLLLPPFLIVFTAARRLADRALLAAVAFVLAETMIRVTVFALSTSAGDSASLGLYFETDYYFFSQLAASIGAFLLALAILGTLVADIVDQYQHAAEHDPLTQLMNRRGFDHVFAREQQDKRMNGAVIVGDLDHFKQVNDRFGHAAGDAVLKTFADVLRHTLPSDAILARFGGEEFVIFLKNHSAGEAAIRADIVRQALVNRSWAGEGLDRRVTASFGVAARAAGDHMIHDAIARADTALYEAKRNGRNRVEVEGNRQDRRRAAQGSLML